MPAEGAGARELLRRGRIEVQGRLVEASNATLFCGIELDGLAAECVYKPVRGERPLWDFPDGTLAGREIASHLLSESGGWGLVPPTILRDGPFGPGMVQLWIDTEEDSELVDIVAPGEVPDGWLPVLRAQDHHGSPVVLAHADHDSLRGMAVLDAVINNADRKGGHILHTPDGRVFGVDHGVSLNADDKLRTVLWGWIGQDLPDAEVGRLSELRALLEGPLAQDLAEHITPKEVQAVVQRIDQLLEAGVFPAPSGEWPAIPWPAF
ncbi:putative repeat protein (TIGR03843 family) [Saccharopolyspora erythraea NRRL 2338]|uniref:Phosphatidylinositol 3-and 4-kinase, catalytic n=2 Tax=Saccharopolyspora erythraea TaxID=1836 RepID=A4FBT5_SACEN|nr:SCO1664 family protein [Saccharopolyspora erythraea]EQD87546.1 phosphatidylinositol kinase [Saccharopolyspora erythraea D]PFG95286.1 putative repeat protein (TIGR03843 family) [Saccharopolyspora erythraea NRRL 2338]QRK91934.1 SCO1664 family protein [Saccharopolyspora erythraea]CAM01510.1 phosphatidylinositol 3-and 4-kinase, catalytic [Saccharopolyspora erythraea NRRL 2338]